MRLWWRSLTFYRGTSFAVLLGVIAGTAALTGALIVGASMRGSLRMLLLERLGSVANVIESQHFIAPALPDGAAGYIELEGSAVQTETRRRASRVQIIGIDEAFASFGGDGGFAVPTGRDVVLNETLAERIGAAVDDDVILRFHPPNSVSRETLLGRRDEPPRALRLTVAAVVPNDGIGGYTTQARQYTPANAFVSREILQRELDTTGFNRVATTGEVALTAADLVERTAPPDLGLRVRRTERDGQLSVESDALLVPPPVADALDTLDGEQSQPVLNYLANAIDRLDEDGGVAASVPYSTVVGLRSDGFDYAGLESGDGNPPAALGENEILLNTWTAEQLGAEVGARIRLTYYIADDFGALRTDASEFVVAGIVAMTGTGSDRTLTPEYEGVTDSDRISDWDPPFPVDLNKVRDADETYWDEYRGTPKAFVRLDDAVRLWSEADDRLGRYTAIRVATDRTADQLAGQIVAVLPPATLGVSDVPVRSVAEQASTGSTDFGGLFIGFSFFLIFSAAMLVALLFRLGIERRAGEIGLLLAVGYPPARIRNGLLLEGLVLAGIGASLGTLAAIGYAGAMLSGLRSWWAAAANAPFLELHLDAVSLAGGWLGSVVVSLLAIAWALRGLLRQTARALLAGSTGGTEATVRGGHIARWVAVLTGVAGVIVVVLALTVKAVPLTGGFFGGGALLLTAALAGVRSRMMRPPPLVPSPPGSAAIRRLGLRNVPRHAGRSMLTISLIASATFLVVSLAAFRIDAGSETSTRDSGSGGNTLYAEATTPLVYDLNDADGREQLGLMPETEDALADITVTPYRLRDGDASSCLNLYLPAEPRLLGATPQAIERGGFRFGGTLAETDAEQANPWLLLDRVDASDPTVVPVIGDEAAIMWQWHKALGDTIEIRDGRGRPVRLKIVALLRNSVLQDELIVGEAQFKRLFPRIDGYGFFLLSAPAGDELAGLLEADLEPFGFDVATTEARLRNYLAVQNTYISTFQTLGGLGLLLGAIGLIAVLLRNVWERRRELALLQAVGFSAAALRRMVLTENAALVLAGLLCGVLPAVLVISPIVAREPGVIPWGSIAFSLLGVLVIGLGAATLAVRVALGGRLIANLRRE